MGTPINRCVGTKEVLEQEPEYRPITGPDRNRRPSAAPAEGEQE
jgi:tRNA (guanine-N7-)-methyltransferase